MMTKKLRKVIFFYDDNTYEEVLTEQASIFEDTKLTNGGITPCVQPYPNGKIDAWRTEN